ncbi:MAG: hypothetical protein AB1486_15610 [Planctomycetota bacterium]
MRSLVLGALIFPLPVLSALAQQNVPPQHLSVTETDGSLEGGGLRA